MRGHMEPTRDVIGAAPKPGQTARHQVVSAAVLLGNQMGKLKTQEESKSRRVKRFFRFRVSIYTAMKMENCALLDFSLEIGIDIAIGIGIGVGVGVGVEVGVGVRDEGWAQASNYSGRLLTNLLLLCPAGPTGISCPRTAHLLLLPTCAHSYFPARLGQTVWRRDTGSVSVSVSWSWSAIHVSTYLPWRR